MKKSWPIVVMIGAGAAFLFKDQLAKLFAPGQSQSKSKDQLPPADSTSTPPPATSPASPSENAQAAIAGISSPFVEPSSNGASTATSSQATATQPPILTLRESNISTAIGKAQGRLEDLQAKEKEHPSKKFEQAITRTEGRINRLQTRLDKLKSK